MLIKAVILLCLAVTSSWAQTGVPTASSLTANFPSCQLDYLAKREAMDPADIVRRLNSGELSPDSDIDTNFVLNPKIVAPVGPVAPPPVFRCEDGPKRIIHTVHGEFYWPPIRRGSCDNLFCRDPPCIARKKVFRTKCVLVFKIINGKWVFLGRRLRRYLDHLECGCKTCNDISSRTQCIATKPCPNGVANSFCFWNKTQCDCCKQIRCPPGQIFNRTNCKCECPPGSKLRRGGRCIGDCEDIGLRFCRSVFCADNRHLKCKVENYKCVCPSCDDVTTTRDCTRTSCLEQRTKPRCRVDTCTKKCRCPNCEEQPDRVWCAKTYCGPNYHLQCRWNPFYQSCSCPH